MKRIKFKGVLAITAWIAAIILLCVSCDTGLDVKQAYGFDLETMPVQKRIAPDETVEIRCRILKEGNYQDNRFYIRMFQPEGKGELRLEDGEAFAPNDLYPLPQEVFRLYYTSRSTDQQVIDVYIQDSFGQVVQKTFSWQNDNGDDENSGD